MWDQLRQGHTQAEAGAVRAAADAELVVHVRRDLGRGRAQGLARRRPRTHWDETARHPTVLGSRSPDAQRGAPLPRSGDQNRRDGLRSRTARRLGGVLHLLSSHRSNRPGTRTQRRSASGGEVGRDFVLGLLASRRRSRCSARRGASTRVWITSRRADTWVNLRTTCLESDTECSTGTRAGASVRLYVAGLCSLHFVSD